MGSRDDEQSQKQVTNMRGGRCLLNSNLVVALSAVLDPDAHSRSSLTLFLSFSFSRFLSLQFSDDHRECLPEEMETVEDAVAVGEASSEEDRMVDRIHLEVRDRRGEETLRPTRTSIS